MAGSLPRHEQHDRVEAVARDLRKVPVDVRELECAQVVDRPGVTRQPEEVRGPDLSRAGRPPTGRERLGRRDNPHEEEQRRDEACANRPDRVLHEFIWSP